MTRYYFHIKDGADLIRDLEGTELSTADEGKVASAENCARTLGRRNQIGQRPGS